MNVTLERTNTANAAKARTARRASSRADALRVSLALVFILFASIASREGQSPEKRLEVKAIATTSKDANAVRHHDEKQKLPETPFLKRLTGLNGAL